MELTLKKSQIIELASQYKVADDLPIEKLVPEVKKRKYLTAPELLELSDWKFPTERNTHNILKNIDREVEEMTNFALTAKTELGRITCLLSLSWVGIAVGSAILHWFHDDNYPIWNFRALETVKFDKTQYKNWFQRWIAYVDFCKQKAQTYKIEMRILDPALWKFSESET